MKKVPLSAGALRLPVGKNYFTTPQKLLWNATKISARLSVVACITSNSRHIVVCDNRYMDYNVSKAIQTETFTCYTIFITGDLLR